MNINYIDKLLRMALKSILHPVGITNDANRDAFDGQLLTTQVDFDRSKLFVFRMQQHFRAFTLQAFYGDIVFNAGNHNLTVVYILRFVYRQQIAIHDADIFILSPCTRSRKSACGRNIAGST